MLYNVRVVSMSFLGSDFYNFIPDALSETNQIWDCSQHNIDEQTLKILVFGLMVCEKIDAPTE